jgi:hypothetical protein
VKQTKVSREITTTPGEIITSKNYYNAAVRGALRSGPLGVVGIIVSVFASTYRIYRLSLLQRG